MKRDSSRTQRCRYGTIDAVPSPEFGLLFDMGCAIVRPTTGAFTDRHKVDNLVSASVARASQLQIYVPANVRMR